MQLSPTLTLSFHSRLLLSFHSSLSRPSNLCALSHSSFHCALCLMNFCEATPSQFLSQLSPSKLSVKCFFSFHKRDPNVFAQLLEYDKRFGQYGSEYTFYDYNHLKDIPSELKHSYKVVVADPPYLVKCRKKKQQRSWACILVVLVPNTPANLEMSFGCSQTMTLE
ncbi:hypothetical protein GLYMA_03G214201v4 [Glycine max]|nr:hypothetical protein GLYMA_03G214201v4 [Glycine max]KAH1071138.1 hypothetical protein GYH30_007948 [Glycine max]